MSKELKLVPTPEFNELSLADLKYLIELHSANMQTARQMHQSKDITHDWEKLFNADKKKMQICLKRVQQIEESLEYPENLLNND